MHMHRHVSHAEVVLPALGVFWHFDGLGPIGTRSDQGSIPCTSTILCLQNRISGAEGSVVT